MALLYVPGRANSALCAGCRLILSAKAKKKKKMCEKSFKKEMHSWAFTYMVMPALIFNLIHKLFFVETSYMTL